MWLHKVISDRNRAIAEGVKQPKSDWKILDDGQIKEQYWGMKYVGFAFLTLMLVLSVETRAQDNPFGKGVQGSGTVVKLPLDQGSCPDYKIGILTPPSDVDFKMTLITPPNDIDPGIVFNVCGTPSQVALGPKIIMPPQEQIILPNQETKDFLKHRLFMSSKNK